MTKEEIIKAANDNGYVVDDSTLAKAMADPAFFKAAFAGEPDVVSQSCSTDAPCPSCGTKVHLSSENLVPAWEFKQINVGRSDDPEATLLMS